MGMSCSRTGLRMAKTLCVPSHLNVSVKGKSTLAGLAKIPQVLQWAENFACSHAGVEERWAVSERHE